MHVMFVLCRRQQSSPTQAAAAAASPPWAASPSSPYLHHPPSHSVWSWLRSVPVQIVALMMVAGLIYVLDPDLLSDLASFSLTFTPDLRHVNGPPPS